MLEIPEKFPKRLKENLLHDLRTELAGAYEQGESYFSSFQSVSLRRLGYNAENMPIISDAARDRGIDAYRVTGNEIEIFQFKSQDFTKKSHINNAAGPEVIKDLRRIIDFIQSPDLSLEIKNRKLKKFVAALQAALRHSSDQGDAQDIFTLRLNLVCLYEGLTSEAQAELQLIEKKFDVIKIFGREVLVELSVIDIDHLLALNWRETNARWIDSSGRSDEWVSITYDERGTISDRTSVICYASARDLIDAYSRFGYQIFEANVRCEIHKSQVNDAIRKQVSTKKGIDEFSLLNNGLTIICANRKKPSQLRISVHQPQVVNGLQTITSLFEAYEKLSTELKEYFDKHCFVLARIYDRKAVSDIPTLVRATNNQNKMEQRNLRSNNDEQTLYEKQFADLGWFYERKDFAWNAFEQNEAQWSTLKGFTTRKFKVEGRTGRPLIRRADNQDIGQQWLAFIGYVNDAAQKRRLIFEDDNYYNRIFLNRMARHAVDYDFDFSSPKIDEEIIPFSPSPDALLLAYLSYRLAKENVQTPASLRARIIEEKNLSRLTDEEIDKRLQRDADYIAGLALSAGPFLFTEMVGLIFMRAFAEDLHKGIAKKLLISTDMHPIFKNMDFDTFKTKVHTSEYSENDIFTALWLLFRHIVTNELAESDQWTNAFFTESSKPRIMYRESTRRKVLDRVLELDGRAQAKALNYDFSNYFDRVGIIKHVRRVIAN